jgi:predicted chitinase
MPAARPSDLQDFWCALNAAIRQFEINTPVRQAAFIAQCAEESDQLWH